MIPTHRKPNHPGTILNELFLEEMSISITELAQATGISRKHLSQIVHGHVPVSIEVAFKLSIVLKTTPELWLNLQRNVDLFDIKQRLKHWNPKKVLVKS